MDKQEYKIKLDQINKLAESGDFKGAADIVDTIDWRHVKSVRTLCMVAEIYEANKRYDDAIRVLKYAYKRSSSSKTVLYRLSELSVRTGDPEAARSYAGEFEELSPNDSSKYILRYKISRAEGRPLSEQIRILNELKDKEYTERWAYELARLYLRNGEEDKCVDECDDMILWFSEGRYVTKAMELKMQIRPLTPAQQRKYDNRYQKPAESVGTSAPTEFRSSQTAGYDTVDQVIRQSDEEDTDREAPGSAIDKLDQAAAANVPEETVAGSARAASQSVRPSSLDAGPDRRADFSESNRANVQSRLADSIRAVFSGIQDPETVRLDDTYDVQAEAFTDDDVKDYVRAQRDAIPAYKVPALEPESIRHGEVVATPGAAGEDERQMTLEDYSNKDAAALDLKELFAETTSHLASEIATGDYIKTDTLEEDRIAAELEREAAEAAEEVVEEAAEEVVEAPVEEAVEEVIETPVEEVVEEVVEAPVEEAVEEVIETPVEEAVEEVIEAPVEEVVEEVIETPAEEVVEEVPAAPAEETVEEVVEEIAETPEEVVEEVIETPAEETIEEVLEETPEEIIEVPTDVFDELVEAVIDEPAEETAEEIIETPAEEIAEEVIETPAEEIAEEVIETPAEVPVEDITEAPAEEFIEESYEIPAAEDVPAELFEEEPASEEAASLIEDLPVAPVAEPQPEPEIIEGQTSELPTVDDEGNIAPAPLTLEVDRAAVKADESLGLTREFNFEEELQKAMDEGQSMSDAAEALRARASLEAAGAVESTSETISDTQEMPFESFIKKNDYAATATEMSDLSSVDDLYGEVEESRSIIENIMEEPETLEIVDVEPRKLDETEAKVFTYFAKIPGIAEQVTEAIADVHNNAGDKTSRSGNIVMIGRQGSGKTRLADALVLAICRDLHIEGAKLAHIIGEDLNKKDPAQIVARMSGGFLVIEGAGALNAETVDKLNAAMEFRTDDLIVILEDEKRDALDLLAKYPAFAEKFTSYITIPVFTNDELVTFGKTYCKELGYKMDEMCVLALYTMIGDNQKDAEPVTVGKVRDMIDMAIARAEKGSRRFGRKLNRKELDPSGRVILHEKDFNF